MRKNRVIAQDRCYHLFSRLAHRAFFLDDEEKDRAVALLRRVDMGRASGKGELSFGDVKLSEAAHEVTAAGVPVDLTMTEFALLRCLLEGGGSAVSRDVLLEKVWGIDVAVETRVTDETVRRVRRKLQAASSRTQIKAVWGFGYKLEVGDAQDKR